MVTHLEPDILECEVKWEIIICTKLAEVTEFLLSYLKILRATLSMSAKFENSAVRTGKGQFSFQSQRKAMPKNAQTTAQLHSSHLTC